MTCKDTTTAIGRRAEDAAARHLEAAGVTLLERNFRCRGGEIDLIGRAGKTLLFIEVRLRRNGSYGGAAASITPAKQARIILAARHYLATRTRGEPDCRFDAVLIDGDRMDWLKDAFSAG